MPPLWTRFVRYATYVLGLQGRSLRRWLSLSMPGCWGWQVKPRATCCHCVWRYKRPPQVLHLWPDRQLGLGSRLHKLLSLLSPPLCHQRVSHDGHQLCPGPPAGAGALGALSFSSSSDDIAIVSQAGSALEASSSSCSLCCDRSPVHLFWGGVTLLRLAIPLLTSYVVGFFH